MTIFKFLRVGSTEMGQSGQKLSPIGTLSSRITIQVAIEKTRMS